MAPATGPGAAPGSVVPAGRAGATPSPTSGARVRAGARVLVLALVGARARRALRCPHSRTLHPQALHTRAPEQIRENIRPQLIHQPRIPRRLLTPGRHTQL
ncbi:hypothetical protein, partial [Arthrobacter sp. UYP6]|uniref:hypothetical protein n=1 Tax=Arthrobacter sp. UYP6 TaxID=1756378 RepID=UPI003393AA8E